MARSPDRLNLGCGAAHMADAVNVDSAPKCLPDLLHDLRRFPWPLPSDSFREIWCHDILEHLPDTVATMNEIHRVAVDGAIVHITTPHFTCANAFSDPTHCHQFGMFTFDFFVAGPGPRYTDDLYSYRRRLLVFHPTRKNALVRRIANRWPRFYETHLAWIFPAFFISVDLVVHKSDRGDTARLTVPVPV